MCAINLHSIIQIIWHTWELNPDHAGNCLSKPPRRIFTEN